MTARRRVSSPIHYRTGDANRLLRLALLEEWGWRCYWHGELLTFATAQIDHIVPRTTGSARLAELIRLHSLPAEFDLDAPGNLAPACAACNNRKRDTDYLRLPAVSENLLRARTKAPAVVRRVRDHAASVTAGRSLVEAVTADLTGPKARREFLSAAPAVFQTAAALDENQIDYQTPRDFDHPLGGGEFMPVALTLDRRGREAQATIATLFGCELPTALDPGLCELVDQVEAAVAAKIEKYRGESGDIGPISTDHVHTRLEFSELRRRAGRLRAQFTGVLTGGYTASVVDTDQWGDGLVDRSAVVEVMTDFAMTLSWALTDVSGSPRSTRVRITRQLMGGNLV